VWPALDGIDGTFQLKEKLLRFDVDRAHYKGVAMHKVTGKIDDLGNRASSLIIAGDGHGPLADMLDYVNNSALGGMAKHETEKIHAEGPAALALKLTVPRNPPTPLGVTPPKVRVAVEGSLAFENDRLAVDNVPPLSQLRGKVHFTERTAQVDGLTGQFMGGEVRAKGGLNDQGAYALNLSGQVAVDAARDLNLRGLPAQVLTRMNGSAPYDISVRGAKGGLPDVAVHSDLTGLALNLPAPFNKPIGTPMPFDFTFRPTVGNGGSSVDASNGSATGNGLQRADLTFGPIAATYLLRHTPGQPPEVVRGVVGVNRTAELPSEGVIAAVDIDALDADAWRALFLQMRKANEGVAPVPPSATAAQFMPNRFAIHIGTLTLLKRHWESVVVGASHNDRQWQANIASNQVSGHLSWVPGAQPGSPGTLQARLARLVIPSATENDLLGPAINQPAQNIPSIDLVVNELIVRERNIGKLEVNAHNFEDNGTPVWQLDSLEITNPAAVLKATANWRTGRNYGANQDDEAERSTELDFKLDIKDAGLLLERAGLPRTLKAGEGSLAGKLGWRGGPTKPDYPTLNGNLAVDLRHGQILKVDPGVAKLLGVLSLQSLARYASMNFRDVIGEGLPFEHVTGTAQVVNGIGSTNNFELVTAPARAEMKGTVDMTTETQDLNVHVVPTVSAGAGVVAAAIINPLLGIAALVGDFALSHSIEHAFARDYSITGSWAKPHVERVHGDSGNMNAPAAIATPN
jgi:uncharacterized protein (TIGR02099 family)